MVIKVMVRLVLHLLVKIRYGKLHQIKLFYCMPIQFLDNYFVTFCGCRWSMFVSCRRPGHDHDEGCDGDDVIRHSCATLAYCKGTELASVPFCLKSEFVVVYTWQNKTEHGSRPSDLPSTVRADTMPPSLIDEVNFFPLSFISLLPLE